jgi:hypothetical protein
VAWIWPVSANADVEAFYRRYPAACDAHDFDALDRFVAATFYRLAGGRITEVWVAADDLALLRQIS